MSLQSPPSGSERPPLDSETSLRTVQLTAEHEVSGFRSGAHAQDDFLRRHALSNARLGISRTFVLPRRSGDPTSLPPILGFYSLTQGTVQASQMRSQFPGERLPGYPLGVSLLAQLAVDARCQGRRLGDLLLVDALERVRLASSHLGGLGVLVDASEERVLGFYARVSFQELVPGDTRWPRRLFLPMRLIDQLLVQHDTAPR